MFSISSVELHVSIEYVSMRVLIAPLRFHFRHANGGRETSFVCQASHECLRWTGIKVNISGTSKGEKQTRGLVENAGRSARSFSEAPTWPETRKMLIICFRDRDSVICVCMLSVWQWVRLQEGTPKDRTMRRRRLRNTYAHVKPELSRALCSDCGVYTTVINSAPHVAYKSTYYYYYYYYFGGITLARRMTRVEYIINTHR